MNKKNYFFQFVEKIKYLCIKILMFHIFCYLILLLLYSSNALSSDQRIMIASTTSTYDTGLLTHLNNEFKKKYKIDVQILSQGTGQAIKTAMDGNVEILLVHHKKSELRFINEGYGVKRYDLMYNDYVLVGPKIDNNNCNNIYLKLKEIIDDHDKIFISRGDDSGTHKKELELWKSIKFDPKDFNSSEYLEVGQGMGNTLLISNEKLAYTISDRSTWISFNRKNNLKIICQSEPPLKNQYGLILVNPNINKNLNYHDAQLYIKWILSSAGKNLINNFKKDGHQLFFFNNR